MAVVGDENNNVNFDVKIRSPPASFRSAVWQHFGFKVIVTDDKEVVEKEKTVCKICKQDVSYKAGNTSNMAMHLKRKHGIALSTSTTSVTSPVVTKSSVATNRVSALSGQLRLQNVTKYPLTSSKSHTITKAIAAYLATDMRPYSTVENEGFKHLIKTLDPRYDLPSRTHIATKVMPSLYSSVKSRVLNDVKNASSIALTTDGWTSRATQSYITITSHYVDNDFLMKSATLQTRHLGVSHTGENLAEVLKIASDEWGLKKDLPTAVTTDNASNIVAGVNTISDTFTPHIRCFAHTLNLATQKAIKIPQVERISGRIRRVVTFFHKSTTASAILESKQLLLDLPKHKLIQDVATRWNSTYDMFTRYIEQQPAIFATLLSKDVKKNAKDIVTLSDDDLKAIDDLVNVLKPMKNLTTLMCDSKHPTVSLIHPAKEMLLRQMAVRDDDSVMIKAVKHTIISDLEQRYHISYGIINIFWLHIFTLLCLA